MVRFSRAASLIEKDAQIDGQLPVLPPAGPDQFGGVGPSAIAMAGVAVGTSRAPEADLAHAAFQRNVNRDRPTRWPAAVLRSIGFGRRGEGHDQHAAGVSSLQP